jgi:hypothetical protein
MEGNKDEAERCIDYAQQAFNYGDRAKAERFLKKAEKLYPTQKAKGVKEKTLNNILYKCNKLFYTLELLELLSKLEETTASSKTSADDVRNRRGSSTTSTSAREGYFFETFILECFNFIYFNLFIGSQKKEESAGSSSKSSGPEFTHEQHAAVKK